MFEILKRVGIGFFIARFVFEGFLPSSKKERKNILSQLSREIRTVILYEAPHHLKGTLKELTEALGGERRVAVIKELTKMHESVLRTTLGAALDYYTANTPRGEYVLVIDGAGESDGGTTPTGIITNNLPFIVIIAGGVGGAEAATVIKAKKRARR